MNYYNPDPRQQRHPQQMDTSMERDPYSQQPPPMYSAQQATPYNQYVGPGNPQFGAGQYHQYGPSGGFMAPPSDNSYNQPRFPFGQPQDLLHNPLVADAALHYGSKLMGTGKELVDKELNKYVSMSLVRHYFAVDTKYVGKKLQLIVFPFSNTDWSRKFQESGPDEPRNDSNSPDFYIPLMAYVTYILVAGLALGTQNRFKPDVLAMCATQALAWAVVEMGIQLITIYISNINTNLNSFELLAFAGYKFVGINVSVLMSLVFYRKGYYFSLLYCSIALIFFLIRTLKWPVLNADGGAGYGGSSTIYTSKRKMYLILSIALSQPVFMWWLSYDLIGLPAES